MQDLIAAIAFAMLAVIFILVPPLNETPLRIVFALPLIFFIPGYVFIAMMFPKRGDISNIERFTLSVGFSIAITVFDGFAVSLTQWLFRPNSISISLLLLTIIFAALTYIARRRHLEEDQFTFSVHEFIESIRSDDENIPKKDRIPPEIEKALIIALVGSIIIAAGMLAYAKVTQEEEQFTALYILGSEGMAENYPTNASLDDPITVTVGVENYEKQDVNYILQMRLDGEVIQTVNVTLSDEEKWEDDLTYQPEQIRIGRSKLEYALFKEEVLSNPYRSVHLWITHDYSAEYLQELAEEEEKESPDILQVLENYDMEQNTGWSFETTDTNVNGTYVEGKGIFDSQAFVFKLPYERKLPFYNDQYYDISQNIRSDQKGTVVLSLFVKDTYTQSIGNGAETQLKQILINNILVWENGIGGNDDWQHVYLPIILNDGNNLITLRSMQKGNTDVHPVEILWDEVIILPISEFSPYVSENGLLEFDLPRSEMLPLPIRVNTTDFEVQWNGTDIGSGIDHYLVEYSSNGTNWQTWLSESKGTSATFTGIEGNSYYFRTQAIDGAGNWEIAHENPDTNTTIDLTGPEFELEISPNPSNGPTLIIVRSEEPLAGVECLVTTNDFQNQRSKVKMTSDDSYIWSGYFVASNDNTYTLEVTATDLAYHQTTAIDNLIVDTSLEDLILEISEKETANDVKIKITSSVGLKNDPTIEVVRNGKYILLSGPEIKDNTYTYQTNINSSISDGKAYVYVTVYTVGSEKLTINGDFIINRN
ncbi:DUF1616 domain-containing protein [Methanococcoides alaskense]|uniref:Membrane protein n=2 Tax=Methanococcoides alaskense TaxID=325778 RepID=A0AA90U0A8_9EURY|nr:DUF1616 domain-containing protein [Methanococcoides alaskense]MDR6223211.1 putative membrane protein [Methanococcoides alaskense]